MRLIETFLDVFESRNFNRSADRLNLTQSSISGRIRSLEEVLDTQLFERGRAGATPTPAGFRFEPHARLLLASWDQARRDVGAGPKRSRLLRLAGQFSLMRSVLVDWVIELRTQNPDTAIDLQAEYSSQIVRDLSLGTVDIGVLYSPQYLPDLDIHEVGSEQFVMVSTQASTLAQVPKETYINTGYTSYFDQLHHTLLPDFSDGPLSVGFEELSVELLGRIGGSTYVPNRFVNWLKSTLPDIQLVKDAPIIDHPVFTAVHVRRRHYPQVVNALGVLKKTLKSRPGRG